LSKSADSNVSKEGGDRNPGQEEQATGSCWHGFRSFAGSRGRNSGGHGSWATSHWETARDQRIRAARFTTIKMRKGKWYVIFLFPSFYPSEENKDAHRMMRFTSHCYFEENLLDTRVFFLCTFRTSEKCHCQFYTNLITVVWSFDIQISY